MAPIVNDYFRFKSLEELEETEKQFNSIMQDDDDENNGFSDDPSFSVYIYILMLNKITLSFFGSNVRQHLANPLFART